MSAKPAFARRGRTLQPGQRSELTVINVDGTGREVIFTADEIFEAPNWTTDGKALIFNRNGRLYRFDLATREPTEIATDFATENNNDHVLSFDGKMLAISHRRDHAIWT